MLNKKQTFELYEKIMEMRKAMFHAGAEFNSRPEFKDPEAQDKAVKTLANVLILLKKNCKEDFYEWPDEV